MKLGTFYNFFGIFTCGSGSGSALDPLPDPLLKSAKNHRSAPIMTWLAGDFYSSHRPVYNLPYRIRRGLFHLGRGVGVGVQCEAGGVVAEGIGEGLHIYAVFQG